MIVVLCSLLIATGLLANFATYNQPGAWNATVCFASYLMVAGAGTVLLRGVVS